VVLLHLQGVPHPCQVSAHRPAGRLRARASNEKGRPRDDDRRYHPGSAHVFQQPALCGLHPQITRAIRDQRGAEAISFAAWSMFLISHASAMTETLVDNEQWTVGFMFWGNVIGCSAMLFIAVATARAARKSASYSAVPIRGTMGSRLNEVTAMATYKGKCFCGAVQLEASGEPEGMGYCHCRSCRSWSGGPVNAFTLWKPGAVRVTAGVEYIGTFQKTALSFSGNTAGNVEAI
jgi:hypothetical protein